MSTHDTGLDSINNICSLTSEICMLAQAVAISNDERQCIKLCQLIESKARTVKDKAQRMENRLKQYKAAITSLGFKRVKPVRK